MKLMITKKLWRIQTQTFSLSLSSKSNSDCSEKIFKWHLLTHSGVLHIKMNSFSRSTTVADYRSTRIFHVVNTIYKIHNVHRRVSTVSYLSVKVEKVTTPQNIVYINSITQNFVLLQFEPFLFKES